MRRLFLILVGLGLAVAAFGVSSAQQAPVVVRYRLEMPGLAAPLRIVQLSDSHASRIDMPPARLARIVAQINALNPDLVLLTGDYVSGDPDRWSLAETRIALAPFDRLRARDRAPETTDPGPALRSGARCCHARKSSDR